MNPHYRAEEKHVGTSQNLQGQQAHCQNQRLKKKEKKRCRYNPNPSATGEKRNCVESMAPKKMTQVFDREYLYENVSYLITHRHY